MPKKVQVKPTREEMQSLIKKRLLIAPELSDRAIARSLNVSPSTVGKIRKTYRIFVQSEQMTSGDNWDSHPYLIANPHFIESLDERGLRAAKSQGVLDRLLENPNLQSPRHVQSILNKEAKDARKNAVVKLSDGDFRVFCGDIRVGFNNEVADASVHAIICDPPYSFKDYPDLWEALSQVASRVLVPNGVLVCMSGQASLDKKMFDLSKHLRYFWTLAYLAERKSPKLFWAKISPRYKAVLIYAKNFYNGDINNDVIRIPPDKGDKDDHKWGQSVPGIMELVTMFSNSGDVVGDFCMGAGSTGIACALLGNRKFIGSDINPSSVEKARDKITQALKAHNETNITVSVADDPTK